MALAEAIGVPALGRQAEIGMLYDIRAHKLFQKAFLWEPEDVTARIASKQEKATVQSEVTETPSFESIAAELFIPEGMQLDILCGTIRMRGAASVLQHPGLHLTGLLHVFQNTRIDKLPFKHLEKIPIRNTKLLHDDVGTHVVMGITYGAAAFLLMDKENFITDSHALADEMRNGNVPPDETKDRRKFTIYGDFGQTGGLSLSDVQIYFSSPDEKTVYPKFLWLCPLEHFHKRVKVMQQEIPENLRYELLQVLTGLNGLEPDIMALQTDPVYETFTWIGSSLVAVAETTKVYTEKTKEKIGKRLPEIRAGEAQTSELRATLAKHYESPFQDTLIQAWISIKQAEKDCLRKHVEILSTAAYEDCFSSTQLNRKLRNSKIGRLVVLTFSVLGMSDPFADDLLDNTASTGDIKEPDEMDYWFSDPITLRKMEKDVTDFVSFAQANVDQPGVCCAIGKSKERWTRDLGVSQIIMYANGAPVPFVPAKKAPSLLLTGTTPDTVTVSWSAQPTDFILHYLCEFRDCDGKISDWIVTQIPNDMRTAHVRSHTFEGLTTSCLYEFRVSAVYKNGFEIQTEILGPLRVPSARVLIDND